MGFEPMTSSLPRRRSTPELLGRFPTPAYCLMSGAGDEARTRDPQLGRLMLYQLSYSRPFGMRISDCGLRNSPSSNPQSELRNVDGAGGRIRTYVRLSPAGFTARCH